MGVIKGAQTIGQFKILEWVDKNFIAGSVTVEFIGADMATITDREGGSMKLQYIPTVGVIEKGE